MIDKTYAVREIQPNIINKNIEQYPYNTGNTFSIIDENDHELTIANMNYENFTELLQRKILTFPIQIVKLDKYNAFITDVRVPSNWKCNFDDVSYEFQYSCQFN